ncbi:MAG: TauD/TfdA family dioxygenase [Minwuiales bacterium]|nr:TauD/TfdA family dioxygenase [Minwuiales bacterium]
MELVPLGPALGAEVRHLDISKPLDDATVAALRDAWLEHGLLLFRDQTLNETALADFSHYFGDLEPPPASERRTRSEAGSEVCPDVWVISNVIENGKAIGSLGAGEAEWHTDMSYIDEPPSASILFGLEVPPAGGDTHFADMYKALDRMPEDLHSRIAGRKARHDSSYTSAGDLRLGAEAVVDVTKTPGSIHPIERTHPESGRQALYLGRRRNGYVEGLPVEESEALLDDLWDYCTRPEFVYVHSWRPGDLLVWDNRCVIHRRDSFDPSSRRVMLRTQIKGGRTH